MAACACVMAQQRILTLVACAFDKLSHEPKNLHCYSYAGTSLVHASSCNMRKQLVCVWSVRVRLAQVSMPMWYDCLCSGGRCHSFRLCSSAVSTEALGHQSL